MPLLPKDRPGNRRDAGSALMRPTSNGTAAKATSKPCTTCGGGAAAASPQQAAPVPISQTQSAPCRPCVEGLLQAARQMLDFDSHRKRAAEFLGRAITSAGDQPELQALIADAKHKLETIGEVPDFTLLVPAELARAVPASKVEQP